MVVWTWVVNIWGQLGPLTTLEGPALQDTTIFKLLVWGGSEDLLILLTGWWGIFAMIWGSSMNPAPHCPFIFYFLKNWKPKEASSLKKTTCIKIICGAGHRSGCNTPRSRDEHVQSHEPVDIAHLSVDQWFKLGRGQSVSNSLLPLCCSWHWGMNVLRLRSRNGKNL